MPDNTVRLRWGPTSRGVRLLLAVLLALGTTVFVSMATQQPAHAATPVNEAHRCEVINTLGNGNQAAVCTDINMVPTQTGFEVWGTGEYFCQGPSVQCKGIHAGNSLSTPQGDLQNRAFSCSTTACPNGGRALVSTNHFPAAAGTCVNVAAIISTAAAILVDGTSTAFHPDTFFSVSKTVCG